jgi:hypothetical protein
LSTLYRDRDGEKESGGENVCMGVIFIYILREREREIERERKRVNRTRSLKEVRGRDIYFTL